MNAVMRGGSMPQPNTWQLYDAKNRLSELVERTAIAPQHITVRGKERAVLVSSQTWDKMNSGQAEPEKVETLGEMFAQWREILDDGLSDEEIDEFFNTIEEDRKIILPERGTPVEFDFD
jgi:prevent-host-death family protein